MNCKYDESLAYRFADDTLAPSQRTEFAGHLDTCAVCRTRVTEAREVNSLLRAGITPVPAPPDLMGRVMQSVAVEREQGVASRVNHGLNLGWRWPTFGRRLATGVAAVALALALVAAAAGPESVRAVVQRALFFIPGIGISSVEADNLVATAPVVVRDGNLTFTVEALLSDRESTRVEFSLTGLPGGKGNGEKPVRAGEEPSKPAAPASPPPGPSLRDEAGREYKLQFATHGTGGSASENHIKGTLTFLSLAREVRAVELTMPLEFLSLSGILPDAAERTLVARIPVAPMAQSGAPLAQPQSSEATVRDVTLRVVGSAVENGRLAVLVQGEGPGAARVVALGANGTNPDEEVVLRDSLGRAYKRLEGTSSMLRGDEELSQSLYFEQPLPLAGDLTLAVRSLTVVDPGEAEVVIPLSGRAPGETFALDREVDLGGHRVLLKSARLVQEGQGDPWLYVDVDLGPEEGGRLLSGFSLAGPGSWSSSNGSKDGRQMSNFGVDLTPGVQEARLRLTHPMVSVTGPWELKFAAGR